MNDSLRMVAGAALTLLVDIVRFAFRESPPPANAVTPDGPAVQSRLQAIGYLHSLFHEARGRTPTSLAEFVEFGRRLPGPIGPIVFDEPSLILARDRQPVVIRFGLQLPPARTRQPGDGDGAIFVEENGPVLAHEQTGAGGRRFLVYSRSDRVEEVDDGTFHLLVDR